MDQDRLVDVAFFLGLGHVGVTDPAQSVRRDLPTGLLHSCNRLGVTLQGHGDPEDRDRDAALGEQPVKTPEACPAPVLILGLGAHVAHVRQLAHGLLGQKRLGDAVPVKDRVLAAFLIVDHELDSQTGATRPARVERVSSIPDQNLLGTSSRPPGGVSSQEAE